MKELLIALCAILAVATARVVIEVNGANSRHLFGETKCPWGPKYWCHNLTNSAECKATKYCVAKVWQKLQVPEDNDSVCQVCKDMVQQARDQLESNQTQQDLKDVFEGSCALMHIKEIVKTCDKLVDEFIPELVETLASQMNPSVVCSVAGLCNSKRIDELLLKNETSEVEEETPKTLEGDEYSPDECSKCHTIANHMKIKFDNFSKDNFANELLMVCGNMGSFSDGCSSLVLVYFDSIYQTIDNGFTPNNVCHLTGQCSSRFHVHENDKRVSSVEMVELNDDLPCKLCEQLVQHLRDLLVANTTETEFQLVLEGLCSQTKTFASECKAIVDQYYPEIYSFLTNELDGSAVCQMGGICPSPTKKIQNLPFLSLHSGIRVGLRIFDEQEAKELPEVRISEKVEKYTNILGADELQLPIERMYAPSQLAFPPMDVKGKETCAFCEYLLHYIQQIITNPATEDEFKSVIGKVCKKLPKTLLNTCNEFVDSYGDAVVAILAQEIDPSQVCPMIHVCANSELLDMLGSSEVSTVEEKPSCPLCLLALDQVYWAIQNNKTEANIEKELENLCMHLSQNLKGQCESLVKGYSKELIEMLLADLTPQQVCVYLKFCNPQKNVGPTDKDREIMTNEISQSTHDSKQVKDVEKVGNDNMGCVICEFFMRDIENAMQNAKTRDEIEKIVHETCRYFPGDLRKKCDNFVSVYADMIIKLLSDEVSPKELCTIIGACHMQMNQMKASIKECASCQLMNSELYKLLNNTEVEKDIETAVSEVCEFMPPEKVDKCESTLEVYGQSIINIVKSGGDVEMICSKLSLCSEEESLALRKP